MASIDIYTKRPIRQESSEHVVPSFLGGRLEQRGLIDKSTNDAFGAGIEVELSRALQSLRLLVGGLSDENTAARPLLVTAEDGAAYTVGTKGVMTPVPRPPKFEKRAEGLHIDGTFSGAKPGEAMAKLKRAVRARGRREGYPDPDKLVAQAEAMASTRTSEPPTVNFSTDLYADGCYRATAKIACNLLACHDRDLFSGAAFDPIRGFVLSGTLVEPFPVQPVPVDVRFDGLGPLDHLVTVRSTEEGLLALVVYFGVLAFLVRLHADANLLTPIVASYRVNQIRTHSLRRDRRDDPGDKAVSFPSFGGAVAQTTDEVRALAQQAVRTAGAHAVEIQRELCSGSTGTSS